MNSDAKNRSICIVGGGIMGMTLALELCDAHYDVTILEAEDQPGGLAGPASIGEFYWDRFYHVILLSDTHLLNLLDRLGLKDDIRWGTTRTGFFTENQFYSLSNTIEFLHFPPLNLIDKIRLGATIFYASKIKSWKKLEKVMVTDWLFKLSGKRTFDKIWLPLLKSKLGENYKIASASFIWAVIARMYAARQSGLKKEMFGYAGHGYKKILTHFKTFLEKKGVKILPRKHVTGIKKIDNQLIITTRDDEYCHFSHSILTLPCNRISKLVPQLNVAEKKRLNRVEYQGVICMAVLLKRPLSGFYVTNITEEWVPFTTIIEMTALVDPKHFDGNTLVYLPRYLAQDDPDWNKSEPEIYHEFIAGLIRMYPDLSKKDILAHTFSKQRYVMPVTTLDYSDKRIPPVLTSIEGLSIVNSAQIPNGTMNINEITGHAKRMAKELIRHLK